MAEFDPHRIIRKLAEAEWKCHTCGGSGIRPPDAARVEEVHRCLTCYGGRYNVPFASLRVECEGCWDCQEHHDGRKHSDGHVIGPYGCQATGCGCNGQPWVPEPDVEKACWRLVSLLGIVLRNEPRGWSAVALSTIPADSVMFVQRDSTPEEAVLRAAEAWLEKEAQG